MSLSRGMAQLDNQERQVTRDRTKAKKLELKLSLCRVFKRDLPWDSSVGWWRWGEDRGREGRCVRAPPTS